LTDTQRLSSEQWGELQRTFAKRPHVIMLGPGCHRIGYDRGKAWAEIERRLTLIRAHLADVKEFDGDAAQPRRFLEHLWWSKVSVERRREEDPVVGRLPEAEPREGWTDLDSVRSVLASSLLGVLYECTRSLGNVIATGAAPVLHWQAVAHPGPPGSEAGTGEAEAVEARQRARDHMTAVVDIAGLLYRRATGRPARDDDAIAAERGLSGVRFDGTLKDALTLLKIEAIWLAAKQVFKECFAEGRFRLSGALVEWLADLFWHAVSTDSRVPPSQAEIAFYLNLRGIAQRSERAFSRAAPGELRASRDPQELRTDVQNLLQSYDCGKEPWADPQSDRIAFIDTIAATILERRRVGERVVILSSDFDLALERSLLELSNPEDSIHVVIPVWRAAGDKPTQLEWLFGSIDRGAGRVDSEDLTQVQWQWYHDQAPPGDYDYDVRGPIVVKLNGSPLVDLESVSLDELDLGKDSLEPATIFTEYDALRAIMSFAETGNVAQGQQQPSLAATVLTDDLPWPQKSWIVLGDTFPQWLPRLRLMYSAHAHGRQATSLPGVVHIALDRDFDWPERALLDTLGVLLYRGDLGDLAHSLTQTTAVSRADPDVAAFLANVDKIRARRRRLGR
jgi:hypothetical protein